MLGKPSKASQFKQAMFRIEVKSAKPGKLSQSSWAKNAKWNKPHQVVKLSKIGR